MPNHRYPKRQASLEKVKTSTVFTHHAPVPVGPYNQAILFKNLLFVSGQIGMNKDGELVGSKVEKQTKQAIENLAAILKEAGSSLDSILKTTIYMVNMEDYKLVNEVYAGYFKKKFPARSAVAVKSLPKGALVEIEAIAYV